jgi:hypothetical protein
LEFILGWWNKMKAAFFGVGTLKIFSEKLF